MRVMFGPVLRMLAGWLLVLAIPSAVLVPLLAPGASTSSHRPVMAAVVNNDISQIRQGTQVRLGRDLVASLTDETQDVQWVQVTEVDARRGVQSGRYVAMATVPEDFTANTLVAAAGGEDEPHVSIITSPMAPAAQPLVSYSVARATSQTLGSAVASTTLEKVYLTFTDANVAFKNAASQAGTLAEDAGKLDAQGKQAQEQNGDIGSKLGSLKQQANQVGKGPGLPSLANTQAQIDAANKQAGNTGALSADAQRAIALAAAEAQESKTAGQQSAANVAELDRLAKELDKQVSTQSAGVDGYTTSVAAAAQRQRGMDASLRAIQTQLVSFSTQLNAITSAAQPRNTVPASLKLKKADADDDEATLAAALAAMQALVNQLETDDSTTTAVTLATQLKTLADTNDSGLDDLEKRLTDLRRLYNNQGNENRLPVKCPYTWGGGNGFPWNDCTAWRAGVVTGLDLSLQELRQTQINDKTAELRQLAATNLTNVTAVHDGRQALLTSSRNAVVALQNAIANGIPPAEVIEKVTEIADEAETLSTTAQTLSTTATEQSAALDELDKDSPAVKDLAAATQTMNTTMSKQDDQLAALTSTVNDLSGKLDGLTTVVSTLNQQTTDLQNTGTGLRTTLQQLKDDQTKLEGDLSDAKAKIDEQDARLTKLGTSAADAEAAGKALATQLETLKTQSTKVKDTSAGHATTMAQNSTWPALDPASKQRITSLLTEPPHPDIDTSNDLGWKALATTIAIWVGALGGSAVAMRVMGRRHSWGAPLAGALTAGLVSLAVSLWLVPQLEVAAAPLITVIVAGSVAGAVVAHALRLTLGAAGVWAGMTLLGITVLAYSPSAPSWLDTVRDWSVTSPMLDALRIAMIGGEGIGPKVTALVAWTAVALIVAVLAGNKFRPAPAESKA